jgi:hypothetical protein
MSYGTIKVDTITFTDNSVDKSVSLSGLIQNPTFTGNITVTGTISGDVIRGGTTVSGATVTGTTANFVSGVFTTQISGATVTGTTASFTSGVFTNISGTTATITSGIIASGTAAAPSLAILADLDTGLFSPGANQLAVATNGTRRITVDASGRLLVGTSSGSHPLSVVSSQSSKIQFGLASDQGGFLFSDGAGSFGIAGGGYYNGVNWIAKHTASSHIRDDGDANLRFFTNSSLTAGSTFTPAERLRITSAGLVGIGTTSPQGNLEVSNTASGATIRLTRPSSADFEFYASSDTFILTDKRSSSERLRIDSSGRVGIGTTSPGYKLHVDGSVLITQSNDLLFGTASGPAPKITNSGNQNSLSFFTNGSESVRIDGSKRLLVGTSSSRTVGDRTHLIQIEGNSSGDGGVSMVRNFNDDNATSFTLAKTRGASVGATTIVQNGDTIGEFAFAAADGSDVITRAALIHGAVDGTPGANDMPGRLVFSTTADGGSSPSERLRITAAGLVGIGTSAPSNLLTLNAPNANALTLFVGVNTGEYSSIRGKYGAGNDFAQSEIRFINADNPNGRGALAFAVGTNSTTEHMRITYDGKVGIGDSAPDALLVIKGNSDANTTPSIRLKDGTDTREAWITNSAGDLALNVGGDDNVPHGTLKLFEGGTLTYAQGAGERLRIDSSGRLLVGTSSGRAVGFTSLQAPVQVETTTAAAYTAVNNTNDANGCYVSIAKTRGTSAGAVTAVQNNDELGAIRISGSDGTGFVVGAQIIAAVDGTPGTNDLPTRLVFSTTADGASTPGERMRITSGGNVLVGKTSSSFGTGDGTVIGGAGYLAQTRTSATPFTVIRNGTDGTLVSFEAQNVEEGTISVSGTTVSYNGAHLSRWSQLPSGAERTEILRGSVLSNLDEMCEWIDPPTEAVLWEEGDELPEGVNVGDIKEPANPGGPQSNEQLNRMKVSDVEGDKNVSGVFQAWDDDDDTYTNDFYCAMTGDFIIRIAEGVIVERGDLLMSAGDGTAKPQDDDIIRSKTIAKVTSTNVSCTYEDGSYCVPCVLMAC